MKKIIKFKIEEITILLESLESEMNDCESSRFKESRRNNSSDGMLKYYDQKILKIKNIINKINGYSIDLGEIDE